MWGLTVCRFCGSGLCRKPHDSPFCGLAVGLGVGVCCVGVGADILSDSVGLQASRQPILWARCWVRGRDALSSCGG